MSKLILTVLFSEADSLRAKEEAGGSSTPLTQRELSLDVETVVLIWETVEMSLSGTP